MADRPDADADLAEWKAHSRKWEARARSHYEQIAYLREELAAARAVIASLKAAERRRAEHAALEDARARVAERYGLPVHAVRGDDEQQMSEYAANLAAWSAERR